MIKFVTGKPGGGKGLRVIRLIWEHLEKHEKLIVTNFPVVLENLQEYCIDHGRSDINVMERVRLLRPEEEGRDITTDKEYRHALRHFFCYRTVNGPPDPLPKDNETELDFQSDRLEEGGYRGCVFIIDEIHKLWPARNFQKTSPWMLEYCAEHRHFGDDVILVTQYLSQVDKQVRQIGQDYEIVRNRGKEKLMWFAGPKSFDVYVYLDPPQGNTVHVEKKSFRLDPGGLCDCYKTASRGGTADKGDYAKGMPWWTLYAVCFAGVAVVWFVVTQGPQFWVKRYFGEVEEKTREAVQGDMVQRSDRQKSSAGREKLDPVRPSQVQPRITGLMTLRDEICLWFDDGTSERHPMSEVLNISAGSVIIGTRVLRFVPTVSYVPQEQPKPHN